MFIARGITNKLNNILSDIEYRLFRNIVVKESPKWMKEFLVAMGVRSINNIVDIGNYVTLMTGQPLHMYDYDKLTSNHYSIRSDYNGLVKMLDETDYKVEENDVVITNDGKEHLKTKPKKNDKKDK